MFFPVYRDAFGADDAAKTVGFALKSWDDMTVWEYNSAV